MKKIALLAVGVMIVAGTFAATPVASKKAPQANTETPAPKHKKHHHKKKHHATAAKKPA